MQFLGAYMLSYKACAQSDYRHATNNQTFPKFWFISGFPSLRRHDDVITLRSKRNISLSVFNYQKYVPMIDLNYLGVEFIKDSKELIRLLSFSFKYLYFLWKFVLYGLAWPWNVTCHFTSAFFFPTFDLESNKHDLFLDFQNTREWMNESKTQQNR